MGAPLLTGLVRLRRQEAEQELVEAANRLAKRLGLLPVAVDPAENQTWNGAPLLENVTELLEWSLNELAVRDLSIKRQPMPTKGQRVAAA